MIVELPIHTVSEANVRTHWAAKAQRTKLHRSTAQWQMRAQAGHGFRHPLPCVVTLTRIAPRELDGDNLQTSMKAVRDGIADWLGVDDRNPQVTWNYAQKKGKPKQYAVTVEVSPIPKPTDSPVSQDTCCESL
jgi:hypothetical protein